MNKPSPAHAADGRLLRVAKDMANGIEPERGTSDSVPALPPSSLSGRGSQTIYTAVKTETIEEHVHAQDTGFGQKTLAPRAELVC